LCYLLQVDVACRAFHQETLDDDDDGDGDDASTEGEDGVSPKEVQLFISIQL
jgi:inositol 1,4,5-triphosphate receptor type 1